MSQSYNPHAFIREIAAKSRDDGLIPDSIKGIGRECHAFSRVERRVQEYAESVARMILQGHTEGEDYRIQRSAAGSLIVTFYGQERRQKAVLVHSHLDSVPNGGMFDGVAGVAWALSVLDNVARLPIKPLRSLKVIAWVSEESSPKNGIGCLGSAIATGTITHDVLEGIEYEPGRLLKDVLADQWNAIRLEIYEPIISSRTTEAAFELHIEQGREIAKAQKDMGIVVRGIGGAKRYRIDVSLRTRSLNAAKYDGVRLEFHGVSDHTGATPPNPAFYEGAPNRKDALVASCFFLTKLLQERRVHLSRFEPERDTSYTSIPSKMIAEIAYYRGDHEYIKRLLAPMPKICEDHFGVDVTWSFGGAVDGLVDESYLRVLTLPVVVSTLASQALAREGGLGTTRATVMDLHLTPEKFACKLDLREVNPPDLAVLEGKILQYVGNDLGKTVLKLVSAKRSQPVDERVVEELRRAAKDTGISYLELPSHAGQDSGSLAAAGIPVAMGFVKQEFGVSHSPYESMEREDFDRASRVMTHAVIRCLAA